MNVHQVYFVLKNSCTVYHRIGSQGRKLKFLRKIYYLQKVAINYYFVSAQHNNKEYVLLTPVLK